MMEHVVRTLTSAKIQFTIMMPMHVVATINEVMLPYVMTDIKEIGRHIHKVSLQHKSVSDVCKMILAEHLYFIFFRAKITPALKFSGSIFRL